MCVTCRFGSAESLDTLLVLSCCGSRWKKSSCPWKPAPSVPHCSLWARIKHSGESLYISSLGVLCDPFSGVGKSEVLAWSEAWVTSVPHRVKPPTPRCAWDAWKPKQNLSSQMMSSSGWKSRATVSTLITFFWEEDGMKCTEIMDELGLERVFAVAWGSASTIVTGASAGSELTNADFYRELWRLQRELKLCTTINI